MATHLPSMFRIKAINDIYVDGEQYEELRQSIEERCVLMCLTILKLVRVLGIQRISVGSAKGYGRGHNCRIPLKHLKRLGCNFPARAWGDLVSDLVPSLLSHMQSPNVFVLVVTKIPCPPSCFSFHQVDRVSMARDILENECQIWWANCSIISRTEFDACYVILTFSRNQMNI